MTLEYIDIHPAENINELDGGYRFWFSMFAIVRYGEVWLLNHHKTRDPLMHTDDRGNELVMLWPSLGTAEIFAQSEAPDYLPESVSIDKFLKSVLPPLSHAGALFSLCPAANQQFVSCPGESFKNSVDTAVLLIEKISTRRNECTTSKTGRCKQNACKVAKSANKKDPRLAFALRTLCSCTLWTLQREWLWAISTDVNENKVMPLWDNKQAAQTYHDTLPKTETENVAVAEISLTDLLYFWTGYLSEHNIRLELNYALDLKETIAPLVFDRTLRAIFPRLNGYEFPKCY